MAGLSCCGALSCGGVGGPIKELACFQHRVHDNSEFPRHSNGCPLEADPLPELEAPGPQTTVGRAAGQDDRCCLKEEPPHMAIAPAGDVAVIVDLAGLCESQDLTLQTVPDQLAFCIR